MARRRAKYARVLGGLTAVVAAAAAGPSRTLPMSGLPTHPHAGAPTVPLTTDALLDNLSRDAKTIQEELRRVETQLQFARNRSIARGRAYVRLTRAGLLPAGAGFESLIAHASKVESLRRSLDRDLTLQRDLKQLKLRLVKKGTELEDRLQAMQAERHLMESNRVALESARDRALAFEQAFSGAATPAHTAIYGAPGPADPLLASSGFLALKGRLPFPLTGRTEIRAAKRRAASGPALEMLAPAGSVVRAVAAGTVAFADDYADYGNSIIVDHGDGFFTVSANLHAIDVKVGEDVGSGARLGTIGSGPGGSALYFEIRRGTDTLDPAAWFGI